jgi:SAM-dependent methyltransferase/predicted transcriptional regulator
MFSLSRKQSQDLAHRLLAGHCTLIAWWTLRHAGIFEAILKQEAENSEGLNPRLHATRTNMEPHTLKALLDYLAVAGLVTFKDDNVRLTSDGKALLEHEDTVLELFRAYQPLLDFSEHLLAKLKTYTPITPNSTGNTAAPTPSAGAPGGGSIARRAEYLLESQTKRHAPDLFPALADLVAKYKLAHLLDLSVGNGDLLVHIARRHKAVVGVGIGNDPFAVRRANAAFEAAEFDKRLIAVTAAPFDACLETQRTFDRIGISRQLWKDFQGLLAVNLFSELTSRPDDIARTLAALPKHFPHATLLLVEAVDSPKKSSNRNYFAPELGLLLALARCTPWPAEKWHETLTAAKYKVVDEISLPVDNLTIFTCKPA